jgi:hypothetical protein
MVKGSTNGEDTAMINIYAPEIGATKNIKQTSTDPKGEIDSNIIIAGKNILHFQQG